MLNPIKSFFNYLQKNATKTTNDLSMNDEINASPEGVDCGNFDDPLTDPLAIDDDFTVSNETFLNIPLETERDVTIDKVIFVDIEKLKCKDNENLQNEESDINGNDRKLSSTDEIIQRNGEQSSIKDVTKDVTDSSFAINVNSSEPELEDVTDTSTLLEEFRSDGSDSGLGSDSLRSITEIEKNLATLTPSRSSLKRRSADNLNNESLVKKSKRSLNFGDVTVFYFPRCQGFGCVPTQGGSTLGMTAKHAYKKSFTLSEHGIEQRRLYRLKIAGDELNASSTSSDESKSEDDISENSLSEGDNEAYGFLQPVTARQRRALLKSGGVRKIDTSEKDECRMLRTSREVCGCTCRDYCDPDTCECSQAGIKCQVDRLKPHAFPCGCTRDACANVNGRIEFNPARVKTHFIHTIMRLELEKRHEFSEDCTNNTSVIHQSHSKWWSQMRVQQQQQQTPHQAESSCSYTNYSSYSNGIAASSSQYPTKIPPISTMVASGQESLDLHYAYREEYESASSSFNSMNNGDYYTNYNNYHNVSSSLPTSLQNVYQNGYQVGLHQNPQIPSYQQHQLPQSTFNNDCQYSNYTPTNASNRYHHPHNQHSRVDVNGTSSHGYVSTNYSSTQIHNATTTNNVVRVNYQQTTDLHCPVDDNFCSITTSTTTASNNTNDSHDTQPQNETNENLSEIIKKSIVETVTA
ncbi:CLUMA_CG000167, isoform A [Clunio marinus]|uniref:CLUMA_CG000167, isoform A n=1 Tax=Clunio marinus TaxID=568069 RepID=A0A1J1HIZ6_9DIPT|nr:CLUMA_CG000167, isoform A [Clunio marinus]